MKSVTQVTKVTQIPKLVASDIGGTLAGGGNGISSFTNETLNQLMRHDVPVALVTGFNPKTTESYAAQLDPDVYLLPQNGSICLQDQKMIWEMGLDDRVVERIYLFLETNGLPFIVYKGIAEEFQVLYNGKGVLKKSFPYIEVDKLTRFSGITGISTVVPYEGLEKIRETLISMTGDDSQLIYTREKAYAWLEVTPAKARKDTAIEKLCGLLKIPLEDTVYFGDNLNDLELLKVVGEPVVMGNAYHELKERFSTVIDSVDADGVAHYLRKRFSHLF